MFKPRTFKPRLHQGEHHRTSSSERKVRFGLTSAVYCRKHHLFCPVLLDRFASAFALSPSLGVTHDTDPILPGVKTNDNHLDAFTRTDISVLLVSATLCRQHHRSRLCRCWVRVSPSVGLYSVSALACAVCWTVIQKANFMYDVVTLIKLVESIFPKIYSNIF